LEPTPLPAKDLGYMLSALTPMRVNRGLDLKDISVGDGPFSDSNGYHTHCITERAQGRQPKMGKSEKKFMGCDWAEKSVKIWVETINCGLKIGEFSACWTC